MSDPYRNDGRPTKWNKTQSHAHQEQASAISKIYVLSGEADCTHLSANRTYLGQQGVNSFYECGGCDGIIIVVRSASVENVHHDADFEDGLNENQESKR